ncbi:MCM domain [Trinorchestia longiramus]|nr:MCM domain [Trinorchestia longiramus]
MENSLEYSALLWLQSSGALIALQRSVRRRSHKPRPPAVLCFLLPLDLAELHHISPELANTVFWQPLIAEEIFQKVVHACCVACVLNRKMDKMEDGNQADCFTDLPVEALNQNHHCEELSNSTSTSTNYYFSNNFKSVDTNGLFTLMLGKEDNIGVPGEVTTNRDQEKEIEPEFGLSLSDTRDLVAESESMFPDTPNSRPPKRKFIQEDSALCSQFQSRFDLYSDLVPRKDEILFQKNPSDDKSICSVDQPSFTKNDTSRMCNWNEYISQENVLGYDGIKTLQRYYINDGFDGTGVTVPSSHSRSSKDDCNPEDDLDGSKVEAEDLNVTLLSLTSHRPIQNEPAHLLTKSQVMVQLRVTGVPPVSPWRVYRIQDTTTSSPPAQHRLALIVARVVAVTVPPSPYTVWARYKCSNSSGGRRCVGRSRDLHIWRHSPGSVELRTLNNASSCTVCGSELVEDPSAREIGKQISVMVHPVLHDEQNCSSYSVHRSMVVTLRDELCSAAVLGRVVRLTVMCVPRPPPLYPTLEAVGAEVDNLSSSSSSPSARASEDSNEAPSFPAPVVLPYLLPLPDAIRELYYDRSSSPWSSVLSLAYLSASSVAPAGTFHTLKLVLLLSLVAAKQGGLSVLSVGSNSCMQLRVLHYMSGAAQHRVLHGCLCSVGPHVQQQQSCKSEWVHAGSVVGASDGVCVMGDLSSLIAPSRHTLYNILESGSCSALSRGGSVALQVPLRTSVWATHDPTITTRRRSAAATLDSSLIDVFSLVVHSDSPADDATAEERLVLHTLLSATAPEEPGFDLLSIDHLKQVVEVCSSIRVKMSASAERLLCGYYVATRAIRSKATPLPVTAIRSLTRVSESHTRLSLRSCVEEWDVAAAVLLCEEALAASTGYSVLQIQPRPHLPRGVSLDVTIGRKNDEYMAKFLDQLRNLAASKNPDFYDEQ